MSLSLKVLNGTRPDRHICPRCSAAQTMLGPTEGADRVFCREIHKWINAPVVECSTFTARTEIGLRMFRELAYVLVNEEEGPRFLSPAEQMGFGPAPARVRRRRNPRPSSPTSKETIQ